MLHATSCIHTYLHSGKRAIQKEKKKLEKKKIPCQSSFSFEPQNRLYVLSPVRGCESVFKKRPFSSLIFLKKILVWSYLTHIFFILKKNPLKYLSILYMFFMEQANTSIAPVFVVCASETQTKRERENEVYDNPEKKRCRHLCVLFGNLFTHIRISSLLISLLWCVRKRRISSCFFF